MAVESLEIRGETFLPRNNHGGRRAGAGRKPKDRSATPPEGDLDYARDILSGDLDYARGLVRVLMRDETQPAELRYRCALAVLIKGASTTARERCRAEALIAAFGVIEARPVVEATEDLNSDDPVPLEVIEPV